MWSLRQQLALGMTGKKSSAADRSQFASWLDVIEAQLRSSKRSWLPYPPTRGPLDLAEARRAAEVTEALLKAGGPGMKDAVQNLLGMIFSCEAEELIPFWERMMSPHHEFGHRDVTASARAKFGGLALRALTGRGSAAATDAILRALPLLGAADRGGLMLEGVFAEEPICWSETWMAEVRRTASEDPEFEGRYLARCALLATGESLADLSPDAVYSFEFSYLGFSCIIELAATDSLEALHSEIQRALRWDNDHPWCFYLNGRRGDQRFAWPHEAWDIQWLSPLPVHGYDDGADGKDAEDSDAAEADDIDAPVVEEDDEPFDPQPHRVGDLGLRAGNKFLYHFDFGDDHLMPLKLRRIDACRRKGAKLPAISNAKGKRPEQYRW